MVVSEDVFVSKAAKEFFLGQLYCVKDVMLDYLAPFIPDTIFHWKGNSLAGNSLDFGFGIHAHLPE